MLDLKEIYEYLVAHGYILSDKDQLILSKKFMEEVASYRQKKTVYKVKENLPAPVKKMEIIKQEPQVVDWRLKFSQFIMDAKIPAKSENARGDLYDINKYSEEAMKEFRRIIEKENVQYEVLIKSTMLYYTPGKKYRKKIANYIIDGDWRTDYSNLLSVANTGEKELKDHIKKEINDGKSHQPWSF